jgi:hypothetical protein
MAASRKVMARTDKDTLRFAVGSPVEYRSAVWRLWAQRNDVYLAARVMHGLIKFSLHQSGKWRVAWSGESRITAQGSPDRVEERWERPAEFRLGWTQGPVIIVPCTQVKKPFGHVMDTGRVPILWSPRLKAGHKYHFTILFASPDAPAQSWQTVFRASDKLLGTLRLPNRSVVALSRREVPMVEKESTYVSAFVADMKINYCEDVPESVEASVFSVGTDDAGSPYVLDMPLGWENVHGHVRT